MKILGFIAVAATMVLSTGFIKTEEGGVTADLSGLAEKANGATEKVTTDVTAVTKQTEAMVTNATAKAEAVVGAIAIKAEDIMGNLNLSPEALKEKLASMTSENLMAYAEQYKTLLAEKKAQIAELTTQYKELAWYKRYSAKGKLIKEQLNTYTGQYDGLMEQFNLYSGKLKEYGVDLSTLGL